jgi:hypothetical protein
MSDLTPAVVTWLLVRACLPHEKKPPVREVFNAIAAVLFADATACQAQTG